MFSLRFWTDLLNLIPNKFSNLLFSNVYEGSKGRLCSTFSGSSSLSDMSNLETRAQLIREFLNLCKNACGTKDDDLEIGASSIRAKFSLFNLVHYN